MSPPSATESRGGGLVGIADTPEPLPRTLPVSVVIPAYNAAATLPAAIASVRAQRALPAEIVVVDDGSTEGEAADAVPPAPDGPEVRVSRRANGGPSRARNAAVELARQPWIAFLDADDTWEPDKLAQQWATLQALPDAVMVSCDWLRPGAARPPGPCPPARLWREPARRILWINRFQTSTVLVRREALQRAGGFRPEFDGAEDWDAWLRVAALGPVAHLACPLVRYADTPTGVSKDLQRLYQNGLAMLEQYRAGGGDPGIGRLVGSRVLTWHHLRFAVGFDRIGERERARACVRAAWRAGNRLRCAEVALTLLLPFLARRVLRRFGRGGRAAG